jgi:hypothetical protein
LRNNYNPYFKEQATIKVEKKEEEHGAAKHEAAEAKKETIGHETAKPAVEPYY